MAGKVYIVGAGPGDPKLISVKGLELIRKADVILADRLVNKRLLNEARDEAEIIYDTNEEGSQRYDLEKVMKKLIAKSAEDKTIVRLRNGDPILFNRGGDELIRLVKEDIDFEIIPGPASAEAVCEYAGIPISQKEFTTSVTFMSGQGSAEHVQQYDWNSLAAGTDTLVILLGIENLPLIIDEVLKRRDIDTPVALICSGTLPGQKVITGTLADIANDLPEEFNSKPLVMVIGDVVKLRNKLRWFERTPLFGKRIMLTRAKEQAAGFTERLEELGAEVFEFPTIKTVDPISYDEIDKALDNLAGALERRYYDWIIFTSVNAVIKFFDRMLKKEYDVRILSGCWLAAIGTATARKLQSMSLKVDYIPEDFRAEGLIDHFRKIGVHGQRFLIPRAKVAREVLPDTLKDLGAEEVDVATCYETVLDDSKVDEINAVLKEGIDFLVFTSSSTVRNLVELLEDSNIHDLLSGVSIICIGPITADTANELGLYVTATAEESTIQGIVETIRKVVKSKQ